MSVGLRGRAGALGPGGGERRRAVFVVLVVVVSMGGGVAWGTMHSGPDAVHLCIHPQGRASVVGDAAECRPPSVVVDVAPSSAVAALEARTSALEADTEALNSRVAALEATLNAVSDPAGNWAFPGDVSIGGSLSAAGSVAAGGDAALGKSLSVGGDPAVGKSIEAGGNVSTDGDFVDNSPD